jgi:uncharacterized membrane protein YjjP (DUF1212 family)
MFLRKESIVTGSFSRTVVAVLILLLCCPFAVLQPAWTSSVIMAAIGTAIGAVPSLAAALYRNWYAIQSIFVAALVYFALTAYGNTVQGDGEPAAAGESAAAGGVVADAAAPDAAAAAGADGTEETKEQ